MHKSLVCLIFASIFTHIACAQNFVPNPSFELYNNCPLSLSGINYSPGYTIFPTVQSWVNPLKKTSPDYLNKCAPQGSNSKIPNTIFGHKETRTGNAYAGIIAKEGQYSSGTLVTDYREYIQCKLLYPLLAGKRYCVIFYVSPAITGNFVFNYVAIDQFGANFSSTQKYDSTNTTLNLPYHVSNMPGKYFTDTSVWYKIKGIYTAAGGEQWMTIGCLNPSGSVPPTLQVYPPQYNAGLNDRIYLFIDDVSVFETTVFDTVYAKHDTSFCAFHNLNYTASGSLQNGDEYLWNDGSTSSSQIIQDTGIYWCATLRDCGVYLDTFHVHYKQFIPLTLGNDSINCANQPITIAAPGVYNSYLWNTGSVTNTITVSQSGMYTLLVKDDCGTQQRSINITIQPPTPEPKVFDTTVCQFSQNVLLNVTGNNISWYNYLNDIFGFTVQPAIITLSPGKRVLYVTQKDRLCESARKSVTVTIKYKPQADLPNYYKICATDTITIGKEYPDVQYAWNTGELNCCIRPFYSGIYSLAIFNECGIVRDSINVDIESCDECVMIPNAFTPDNDGKNDIYKMIGICPVRDYHLQIYNRWGYEIYETKNINDGWNGKVKNTYEAEPGVYVYVLEYQSSLGRKFFKKGNFTLLR